MPSPPMSNSGTRKPLPTYREYGGLLLPLTPVDAKGGSANPESTYVAQAESPEADLNHFGRNPPPVVPVVASPEEVRRAQELRREIKTRYSDDLNQPRSFWWVGVD
jgi:hypothetical protein